MSRLPACGFELKVNQTLQKQKGKLADSPRRICKNSMNMNRMERLESWLHIADPNPCEICEWDWGFKLSSTAKRRDQGTRPDKTDKWWQRLKHVSSQYGKTIEDTMDIYRRLSCLFHLKSTELSRAFLLKVVRGGEVCRSAGVEGCNVQTAVLRYFNEVALYVKMTQTVFQTPFTIRSFCWCMSEACQKLARLLTSHFSAMKCVTLLCGTGPASLAARARGAHISSMYFSVLEFSISRASVKKQVAFCGGWHSKFMTSAGGKVLG